MGRPTEFDVGSDTIEVSYDELGGLEKLVSTTTGNTWAAGPSERTPRGPDHRAEVLKGLGSAGRQAGHVVLDFDETTFEPVFDDPLELGVPGLAEARALLAVASPLLGGDGFAGTSEFEKPSNPVFQPDEYRSTNCCVPCDYYICIDCVIGGYVASWSLCYCQTPGLMIYYDPYPYWNNPTGPDTIDQIIAEYEDLGRYPIPSRGDFVKEHSSEHFSKYELNGGDYDYFIPGVMTELAEAVRAKYNERVSSMVVGNIDDDSMEELVLFGEWNSSGKDTLKVVQWDGSSYRTTGTDRFTATLGALGDIDADGRQELVLVHVPDPQPEAEGREPATLVVARYSDGSFERIRDYDIGLGVMGVAVGDLDGNDRAEIVTCEVSDGGIDGQIAIYSVDPVRGIERIFARNGFTKGWCVLFLGVFRSGGAAYLFVEQRKEAWKSAFVLEGSRDEGFELVAVTADRLRVYADGLRSTMAYSAERRAYARFLDRETIEFVPE